MERGYDVETAMTLLDSRCSVGSAEEKFASFRCSAFFLKNWKEEKKKKRKEKKFHLIDGVSKQAELVLPLRICSVSVGFRAAFLA